MSSPLPIPPPNNRRSSQGSSNGAPPASANNNNNVLNDASEPSELLVVGGPSSPSPLALRASNSPSSKRRKSRQAKVAPDLHLLEYLASPDSNLICLICHTPFDRPVQLACEHYFCRECLDHAWAAQQNGKSCPTCRSRVDPDRDPRPVPKIFQTMLDELVVRCPNANMGCGWSDQRSNVHDHVMIYCEYTLVECPSHDCRLQISQKDFHKGCLHYTVSCEHCHTSLLKKDLEEHQRTNCANRVTTCPHCSIELLRLELKSHVKDFCPKVVVPCQGTIIGCTYNDERLRVSEHEKRCPMATMAPHFREQQARIERNEARMEQSTRKIGILEDSLSNITNLLYPANGSDSSFPVTNPLDPNNPETFPIPTPDFRLPPASFPPVPPSGSENNSSQPPFDSQVHHLLTLHSSLRDEVSRIANTLTELDGRTNMTIFNESQRVKDEMLHTNAAINSMRMQVHWLMSATLQQRHSTTAGTSSAATAAARTGAGTTTSTSGGRSNSVAGSSAAAGGTQGAATAPSSRPGGASTTLQPLRRLSDSLRQDTKL